MNSPLVQLQWLRENFTGTSSKFQNNWYPPPCPGLLLKRLAATAVTSWAGLKEAITSASPELLLGMAVGLTSSLLLLRLSARVIRWEQESRRAGEQEQQEKEEQESRISWPDLLKLASQGEECQLGVCQPVASERGLQGLCPLHQAGGQVLPEYWTVDCGQVLPE